MCATEQNWNERTKKRKAKSKKLKAQTRAIFIFPLSAFRFPSLAQPTDDAEVIADAALRLFDQIWRERQPVRLIGVGVSGLGTPPRQLSLWDAPTPEEQARQAKVREALTAITARFGAGVVRRGSELDASNGQVE